MKSRYTAAILTLLLLASPIFAADAASAQEMKTSPVLEMRPGTMTVMERFAPIYYADGGETRGSVYYAASSTAPDNIIYTRPSGRLYSFTFHPGVPEKLYYANANQNDIYMVAETGSGWSAESTVFTHRTYVRDIAFAFDQNNNLGLYFSEATGLSTGSTAPPPPRSTPSSSLTSAGSGPGTSPSTTTETSTSAQETRCLPAYTRSPPGPEPSPGSSNRGTLP
ncbi:MAG: hypothetical protein NUK54_00940 [Methanothrix sp.]|nr:hypothetical protein [Methanothrix sp.]